MTTKNENEIQTTRFEGRGPKELSPILCKPEIPLEVRRSKWGEVVKGSGVRCGTFRFARLGFLLDMLTCTVLHECNSVVCFRHQRKRVVKEETLTQKGDVCTMSSTGPRRGPAPSREGLSRYPTRCRCLVTGCREFLYVRPGGKGTVRKDGGKER